MDSTLGSGAFGVVYKGTVKTSQGTVEAAVKTVKKGADILYLKSLLTELKILIHLGNHESIVNLIGAWTDNIENGEAIVAVELCHCCLLTFLRTNSSAFLNCVENGELSVESTMNTTSTYMDIEGSNQFSTFNLIQWGKQIATALEYIAGKHIIHGDLAARNVFLSTTFSVKLCDFGLSRQLVDYNYIKSQHMAIESLSQMKFSTKSDVWAFGVTLWEIFSLGHIPYPIVTWSQDFVKELEDGLRLPQPKNVPIQIWNLMTECWQAKPENRPNFTELRNGLDVKLH